MAIQELGDENRPMRRPFAALSPSQEVRATMTAEVEVGSTQSLGTPVAHPERESVMSVWLGTLGLRCRGRLWRRTRRRGLGAEALLEHRPVQPLRSAGDCWSGTEDASTTLMIPSRRAGDLVLARSECLVGAPPDAADADAGIEPSCPRCEGAPEIQSGRVLRPGRGLSWEMDMYSRPTTPRIDRRFAARPVRIKVPSHSEPTRVSDPGVRGPRNRPHLL